MIAAGRAHADASQALLNVLSEMRALSDSDFKSVVLWASNKTPPTPIESAFQPDKTEADIFSLENADRRAVMSWLQGKGRTALYAQGVTDEQIGPKYRLVSPAEAAALNVWRGLPLVNAASDGRVQGRLQISSGFAAAKRDGTGFVACVSFKNISPLTVTRIVVDFPLLSAGDQALGDVVIDRRGEFAPNVPVPGYASLVEWQQNASGLRSHAENCVERQFATPALPVLQARLASYRVVRVEYADGTVWSAGSASPSPFP